MLRLREGIKERKCGQNGIHRSSVEKCSAYGERLPLAREPGGLFCDPTGADGLRGHPIEEKETAGGDQAAIAGC